MDFNYIVNDSYESLLEYQNILHNLDMKMIKCEHVCLINEDTDTLLLAEEEYMSKLKDTLKTIWNKIVEKLEEFIILMRKMINKFRNTFLLSKEFKASFDSVINNQASINSLNDIVFKRNKTTSIEGEKIQFKSLEKNNIDYADAFKILRDPKLFDYNLKISFNRILDLNKFDEDTARKTLENFSKFKNSSDDVRYSTLTKDEIVSAYSVLVKYGPEWINLFEKVRNEAKKQSNVVFNANPDKNVALQASIFQRMINKGITYIQSIMTACFKVCYAIKNVNVVKNSNNVNEKINELKKEYEDIKSSKLNKFEKLVSFIEKIKTLRNSLLNRVNGLDSRIVKENVDSFSNKVEECIGELDKLLDDANTRLSDLDNAIEEFKSRLKDDLRRSRLSETEVSELFKTGNIDNNRVLLSVLYYFCYGVNGNDITSAPKRHDNNLTSDDNLLIEILKTAKSIKKKSNSILNKTISSNNKYKYASGEGKLIDGFKYILEAIRNYPSIEDLEESIRKGNITIGSDKNKDLLTKYQYTYAKKFYIALEKSSIKEKFSKFFKDISDDNRQELYSRINRKINKKIRP